MLGSLGPQSERGRSATMPVRDRFVEGYLVDAIDSIDTDHTAHEITIFRGQVRVLSWERDTQGVLTLKRSGRTVPVVCFDTTAMTAGVYVRCEYHDGLGEYVVYQVSCVLMDFEEPAQDGDPWPNYTVEIQDMT